MPDSAEPAFHKALALDPAFVPSMQSLANCAYSRGDPDRAIALNEEILRRTDLMPGQRVEILTNNAFWPGLALLYVMQGRFREALAEFDAAGPYVEDTVSRIRLETGRARILLRMGRAREVLDWSRGLATSEDKTLAPLLAVQFRARSLVALDSLDAARAALVRLRATEPQWGGVARFEALKITAEIALKEGRAADALAALTALHGQGLTDGGLFDIDLRETRAEALRLAGRREDALGELSELLRLYGSHALAHYRMAQLYEESGRRQEARSEYHAFLAGWAKADPGLPQVEDARRRLGL
jgi:tetratricopeptide (TPR) repeat protein